MSAVIQKNKPISQFLEEERTINSTFFDRVAPRMWNEGFLFQQETSWILDRAGVDALLVHDAKIEYVDLKQHMSDDVMKRHPQYAFELETGQHNDSSFRRSGWFLSENKVTDTYCFLFWAGKPSSITAMRVCLVRKNDIIDKLSSLGIDINKWREYIREKPVLYNGKKYWYLREKIRIVHSVGLPEQPYNIVVPCEYLRDVAIYDKLFVFRKTASA